MDRFDLLVDVDPVGVEELMDRSPGESSAMVRARVERARVLQRERLAGTPATCNAHLPGRDVRRYTNPGTDARALLADALSALSLSGRAHDRILRVSRTIADLEGSAEVALWHVAEALAFRMNDGGLSCSS